MEIKIIGFGLSVNKITITINTTPYRIWTVQLLCFSLIFYDDEKTL